MTRIMHVNGKFTDIYSYVKKLFILAMLIGLGATEAWTQEPVVITTDTDNSGAIEDGEKKLYMIQTNYGQSFYIVPQSNNTITTNNILGDYMLWYFLDAGRVGDTQYYYIVNNSTGKYIYNHNGNDRGISIISSSDFASLSNENKEKCKFKFVLDESNGTSGFYNIDVKASQKYYGLNKQASSQTNDNPIRLTDDAYINNINSKWKFIPYNGTFTWPTPPFTISTDLDIHYYKIRNVQKNDYFVSTDATPDKVTYSKAESNSMVWYFKEAPSDPSTPWFKYYYIVNPKAEDKYMYYSGTATNGSNQTNAVSVKAYDSNDEDRFQFIVIQAARGDGNSRVICYAIIPKLLRDTYWGSNSIGSTSIGDGTKMGIISSRSANNTAQWQFVTTNYPLKCTTPTITYSSETGKITIISTTPANTIYYTTDGETEPSSSAGTQYTAPFDVSGPITIKAIATKDGFDDSEVTTKSFSQVATPTIQANGDNTISITCATSGATIYYTTDGSTPTTSSTQYTSPLGWECSSKPIKAIAVKNGSINSTVATGSVTLKCAKPVFSVTTIGNTRSLTISSAFPPGATIYYTLNGGSSTQYSSVLTVNINDVITAYATASGFDDSDVATKTIREELTPTDGKYHIDNQTQFETFIDMASSDEGATYHYLLNADVNAGSEITIPFSGTFDGQGHTISGLDHALFNSIDGGTVKDVILDDVNITSGTNVGAITNETSGASRIYNIGILGGSVGGSNNVGGIVGLLDGTSRVVNCYSYATITGGHDVGGIVGYNNGTTTAGNINTMVMNCMFYGDITGGTTVSPVYGGNIINNLPNASNRILDGLNTFNYYAYEKLKTTAISEGKYNCAQAVEDVYLNRFEFYRQLLNSNRRLAAYYITGNVTDASIMKKWVLETADRTITNPKPYPVLKEQDKYPSIINYDADHAPRNASIGRNKGMQIGRLSVTISESNTTTGGQTKPTGATVETTSLTLTRTDKDFEHFNYNYDKVQLPYYNDVGTKNYTENKVVTGWKITSITGGTTGTYETGDKWNGYNFADRNCTNKDKYDVSKRVFAQGAYFDVPYDVTAITIEPYWGNAAYVADEYMDVVHNTSYTAQDVTQLAKQFGDNGVEISINGNNQKVYTSISNALADTHLTGSTVYDNAVVLVGNVHLAGNPPSGSTPFTVMSIDLDQDNEPDYSFIFGHNDRQVINPIRFDFINMPGIAQAQKPNGATLFRNVSIFKPKGWFETTNTCITRLVQFEYDNGGKSAAPVILQGGIIDQFVSTKTSEPKVTTYIHLGGNTWFKDFGNGTHSDGNKFTPHIPISVTGGDFDGFYLSGTYRPDAAVKADNAECYISGGRFGEVAGAAQQQINGDVRWQIYNADIENFYGGGVNADKPVTGDITIDIYNSQVTTYCGGPKFGNMSSTKEVNTNATGCTFGTYFGAGYGGISYNRVRTRDTNTPEFSSWQGDYTGNRGKYLSANGGIATDFDYEFFVWSTGFTGGRFYVKYSSLSTAQTNDVNSTLTNCIIKKDYYGGGSLGNVIGKATSILNGCEVEGNVFGGGYSASKPKVPVRKAGFTNIPKIDVDAGVFDMGEMSDAEEYTLVHGTLTNNTIAINTDAKTIVTDVDLNTLGQVTDADLTIKGNTIVRGKIFNEDGTVKEVTGGVFGGGDMSAVRGYTKVDIQNTETTEGILNVFGGGNTADVLGNATVTMTGGKVAHDVYGGGKGESTIVSGNVSVTLGAKDGSSLSGTGQIAGNLYGGSAFGAVNATKNPSTGVLSHSDGKNVNLYIYGGTVSEDIFGGGKGQLTPNAIQAMNFGDVTIMMEGGTVEGTIYGGSNINGVLKKKSSITISGGTVGTVPEGNNPYADAVFGGGFGQPTLVEGNVEVNIGTLGQVSGGATINGHVYGGGALGSVNTSKPASELVFDATKKVDVNLYKGTINGNVYGGGLGQQAKEAVAADPEHGIEAQSAVTAIEAFVGGNVIVTLDGAKVPGSIFGCNNLNGTPKGHVKVWVKRTIDCEKNEATARESRTTYDVAAVYGGGNMADYVPTDTENGYAEVLIEGCQKTSINYVYGGGNAAAVPATKVTVLGTYIINTLYGGGNGSGYMDPPTNSIENPGANVGIYKVGNTPTNYGTGKAETKLYGGYINNVYGGSNTKGDVRGGTDVRTKEKGESVPTGDSCNKLEVGKIYGAGSHADVNGDVNIILECMPEDYVDAVYGGAEEATITGDVTLTVTGGKFGRVFGGNNKGGDIRGTITVWAIEDGCKPLEIGELYGGGNEAPYSKYGCEKDGNNWIPNTSETEGAVDYTAGKPTPYAIEVLVVSCTSIGKVFGGGNKAVVIGDTHVKINMFRGRTDDTPINEFRNLGKIGQVFGGGNLAKVTGNTTIDIGTDSEYEEEGTVPEGQKKGVNIISGTYINPDENSTITIPEAGIYGGGNQADVEGDATLNIGTAHQTLGININGDIFGGGYGETTHVTGNVTVNIGADTGTAPAHNYVGYAQITGDIYGGSAKGTVNSADNVNATTDSYTKVNFYGGTIDGNIYGGGEGQRPAGEPAVGGIAANVYGPVTVTMEEGSTTNTVVNKVFGCNNFYGAPQDTVAVIINGGTVINSVYGGGNQAEYTAPESKKNYPAVYINNGIVTENVFGGGYGLSAVVTGNPHITIGDGVEGHVVAIKKSVYGGGELAGVNGNTYIVMNNGTVGTPKDGETVYAGATYGNIYGGGLGTEDTSKMTEAQAIKEAGIITGNTNITVNGGTVLHNIYGGGANGSVGTFTYDGNNVITGRTSGGVANITILGGTIGTDGHENGMIFGASRGDVGKPGEIQDKLAWVYDTHVTIGNNESANPQIKGSVYGSGENGHTYHDAAVTIHSGMVGITDVSIDGGAAYPYRGNVYGGGCGTDKYWVDANSNGVKDAGEEHYNLTAGIVGTTTALGTTTVTINGGHVVRNVYGGGAMGSVTGGTTVNISGNSVIGADGSGGGYVYAASRGYDDMEAGFATVGSTTLNIGGGTVWGSTFGGGQLGTVKGSVAVNVSGGVVKNDVYGGGALANTNTDNWNGNGSIQYVALTVKANPTAEELAAGVLKIGATPVAGYFTETAGVYTRITDSDAKANGSTTYYKKAVTGTWADGKTSASNTTTVTLTGGLIGNAYGGGLGNSTTMANVYGDITVKVNEGVTDPSKGIVFNQQIEHPVIDGTDYPTPVMGRVFGCNNYNGTPTGEVTVHVYSTRQIKKDTEGEILPGHGSSDRKFPYEIQSVYGGGNQADYLPADGKKSHVIIEGCDETSIEKVYGGCNSAVIPETDVLIKGCYDIGYGFGGGNGGRPIKKEDGNWYENEGAIVIGTARIECRGGKIGQVFGGGDSKGSCGNTAPVIPEQGTGDCPLWITRLYGAGNAGDVSHVNIIIAACSGNAIEYVHGGSYNAHVHDDINLTITSGILKNVYGGNDSEGGVEGDITVNIEETDGCNPIIIQNLVGGGNEAAYPGTLKSGGVETPIDRHGKITVNVKSATRIDNIYGGSFNAEADADTEININMMRGNKAGTTVDIPKEFSYIPNISGITNNSDGKTIHCTIDDAIGTIGNVFGGGKQGIVKGNTQVNINSAAKVYIMKRNGSGQVLDTNGNPITTASGQNIPAGITIDCTDAHDTKGAHITGNVFGGGENANVTGSEKVVNKGNSAVYICANKTGEGTYTPVAEGAEKVTISNGNVYGGGSEADVHGNTSITMAGGYVFDGVYGGGLMGSVGTAADGEGNVIYHTGTEAHAGCIGKIVNYKANTGKCTVVVTGGQVGPKEVALADGGMKNTARYFKDPKDPKDVGPVDVGFVFGAGRGEVEDPATDKDADFRTFVKETDVTVGGTAFIMASVYGGGENGRVANDTHVTIEGDCQIGCGEGKVTDGKPVRYTTAQWTGEDASNFTECASWDYTSPFLPHDPYAAAGDAEDAKVGTDGHTYYGSVFGGGSGYYPYKKADGTHEWLRSAGVVYGNTVIDITGGHILTCVYGGNETTDVGTYTNNDKGQPLVKVSGGKCTINMVGGTLGVPRTDKDAQAHPVTCYLFGAGKGDQRTRFNTWTNVQETEVNVSGTARIFGSVFGGGEDGHILGNAQVNIGGEVKIDLNGDGDRDDEGETFTAQNGLKIGTTGTSYVDGNVFGGGRGFSGLALTAGSTGGNADVNIAGGTMLGSIYGGGRLASVGIDFTPPTDPLYGQLVDDTNEKTHGHITINISGGTIGNDVANAKYGGNVFGGSMGRITLLDGTLNPIWPKQAVTKDTEITITGNALIKRNVYGGSEYGIVRDKAIVNIGGTRNQSTGVVTASGTPDIHGSVFGAGYGSDDMTPTYITAGDYAPGADYVFTPMIWTGCVAGDTEVNIAGGTVKKNVYGGGEVASVGLINCHVVEDANGDITIKDEHNVEKKYRYTNLTKHADIQGTGDNEKAYGFALSWPYKFEFISGDPRLPENIGGKATVNITGGHIGSTTWDDRSGYVFGGSKGQVAFKKKVGNELVNITDIHEQRYAEGLCANVRETEVNVKYSSTPSDKTPSNIGAEENCIMGAVYGGGEDGHVYENAAVNITNGLIGLSVYGGGKGEGTYTGTKYVYNESTKTWTWTENVEDMSSWTAGKVYGNTFITMSDGHVMGNVYGGGNLGSVGKGNYAGGTDDYYPAGYGETLKSDPLWTKTEGFNPDAEITESNKPTTMADYFLSSGKCTISITGGTVGTLNGLYGYVYGTSNGTPTGMVFGGSRGRAARDVGALSPRYNYAPDFFLGYVNNTKVTIGTRDAETGPTIYSQVFGGGRDGHVRSSAKVEVNSGTIGQTYAESEAYSDASLRDYQRYHRGNVYGAGSGLGTWNGTQHGTSSGSVTRNTTVDIYGGTIYNSVYGGGAMATVGPPRLPVNDVLPDYAPEDWSKCTVNIYGGNIGSGKDYESIYKSDFDMYGYGGCVYGASRGSRGGDSHDLADGETIESYATVLWTEVNINPHPSDRDKDAVIAGNVYGGARGGQIKKDTKVNLLGGSIAHDAYGGGQGTADIAADVLGNTTVELNKGVADDAKGCVVDKVYGCNDLHGTPKGHVLVHVYGTQHRDKDDMQTKVGPGSRTSLDRGESEGRVTYLNRLIALAKDGDVVKTGIDAAVITSAQGTISGKTDESSFTTTEETAINDAAKNVIAELQNLHDYDVTAVYGGGDLAPYVPSSDEDQTEVIIEGCDVTSIKQVYGGGNAAYVPATNVLVKSAYVIDELFGGGNGLDNYKKDTDGKWYENPGANVGYKQLAHYDKGGSHGDGEAEGTKYEAITNTDPDATTPEGRKANYSIGTGIASTTVNGGYVHNVYGGSNKKGNIRAEALLQVQQDGSCKLIIDKTTAGSKEATIDAQTNTALDCVEEGGVFYAGSTSADILNDVHVRITNGKYTKVFGGNEKAGTITGSITIDIEERGCTPIEIDELYAGGYLAPYSVYGYSTERREVKDEYGNVIAGLTQRIPYKKGDAGALATPSRDPQINIISATKIGKIYGGGFMAELIGSPRINVNMTTGRISDQYVSRYPNETYPNISSTGVIPIGTIGSIYGGGYKGDIIGDTYVEIGTGEWLSFTGQRETTDADGKVYTYDSETKKWKWTKKVGDITESGTVDNKPAPARNAAKITGNVFGGGEGEAKESGDRAFFCDAAMVGVVDSGEGSTSVTIENGEIGGSVYGGGEIGRVEKNTVVTIGKEGAIAEDTKYKPIIMGSVFGAGQGVQTHGYSGLVRGNSTVTIQGVAKVGGSVYGGGEKATIGRYWINDGTTETDKPAVPSGTPMGYPYATRSGGKCTVDIKDDAEIGPDNMTMTKVGGPDNTGHVFGASQGATPGVYSTAQHMTKDNVMVGFASKTAYLEFIETLALATETEVTIGGNAFVKGDVFGGAEQGFVQHDTKVTIKDNCQIGNGYAQMDDDGKYLDELTTPISHISLNRRYSDAEWEAGHLITVDSDPAALKTLALTHYQSSLPECASWKYKSPYAAHDKYANESGYDSKGGAVTATNGHTFYGIVFGGGSGYFPYAPGEWHWKAGNVGGNTLVEIKGGHILTNVYGGNEMTSVKGKCTVNMSGGTIGVPRTLGQITAHPVTCYLFGGGKGDPRVLFNKQTNVNDVEVNISGGWVYGSVFGGGEDGHVLGNVTMNIQDSEDNTDPENPVITSSPKIGTWGTSYVDGNVFGGGRGFAGDAYTAGNVAGSVTMNISGGTMLGSVYGGGRLGSVGYGLYEATETDKYGTMRPDNLADDGITPVANFKRGYVTINITGGTIGNTHEFIVPQASNIPTGLPADFKSWTSENWTTWKHHNHVPNTTYDTSNGRVLHTKGGNVYAGGMGRYYQLDGETPISAVDWWKLGNVKSTNLTISGENTWIMGNVYGGGELGAVRSYTDDTDPQNPVVQGGTTTISITGGTIGTEITGSTPVKATVPVPNEGISNVKYTYGSVYGGGEGQETHDDANERHGGEVSGNTMVGISGDTKVRASVYGGGELAIVGGDTHVTVSGGEIGRNEVKPLSDDDAGYVLFGGATMGNVYGGGKGLLGHTMAGQVKGNTNVNISGGKVYHMVYGGGALASVGDFKISKKEGGVYVPSYIPVVGVPYDWTENTGTATVNITGGTIGISGLDNGLVFGSSRGDLAEPVEDPASDNKLVDPYDKVAWVNKSVVNIGNPETPADLSTPLIKCSVYGGGENGHNNESATVNVYSGTIGITDTEDPWYSFTNKNLEKDVQLYRGNVYGAGSGSDTYTGDDSKQHYNPKSGMVGGNTFVNIYGGHIGRSVYGGGAMASVGTITSETKHESIGNGFGLSWPYAFEFAANTGKATVNVTGGHIGTRQLDGGDVYGSSRGEAGDRYKMAHLAYTKETEVNISYPETIDMPSETVIQNDFTKQCITGSVHGSGENGYVYGDTKVTLNKGLIGHSLYGGGKGKGTYKQKLLKIGATENSTNQDDYYEADIYSLIAGKVFGNTYVTMNGGRVGRNVYGGGNMGSVGKGNYASGLDDYANDSPLGAREGYGEKIDGNLWTSTFNPEAAISESNKPDDAYYFLNSGKTTVKVLGGTVGYIDATDPTVSMKNQLPYGNVFGGSAGEAAPEIAENPRYLYSPTFFSGYVNETDVTIGQAGSGPTILGSVYGGGQDGHVRRDTKVTVLGGEIGMAYNATNQGTLQTDNLDDPQWVNRGNIYGGGSGITKYHADIENMYAAGYTGDKIAASGYSTSSGSVTRFTEVNILGGIIHRNVYGGGSMGAVGAPNMGQRYDLYKPGQANIANIPENGPGRQSMNLVNIRGTVGTPEDYKVFYGGEVYGASRGLSSLNANQFSTSIWTQVNVLNGAKIMGSVFGGGDSGLVKKDADVIIGDE